MHIRQIIESCTQQRTIQSQLPSTDIILVIIELDRYSRLRSIDNIAWIYSAKCSSQETDNQSACTVCRSMARSIAAQAYDYCIGSAQREYARKSCWDITNRNISATYYGRTE